MINPDSGPFIRLTFTFRVSGDENTQRIEHTIRLPLLSTWEIVEAIQDMGLPRALAFASFAVTVANTGHEEMPQPDQEEMAKLQQAIVFLASMFGHRWETEEDRVLAFTYQLLRNGAMDRKTAAEFASIKLKKPYEVDAWRKRVDRWALSHKLPHVGKPRKPRLRPQIR